jgi:DNA (cytosine-5)-methyltransferase 1
LKEAKEAYRELTKGFLLENVKNLKTHDKGRTYTIIHDRLEALGYHISSKVYNSLQFGVAQSRERIYIVGFKKKDLLDAFKWPEPTHSPIQYVKVKDILDKQVESRFYYNDKPLYDKIGDLVTNPDYVYTYRRNYVRPQKQGFAPTLVASMGLGGHNIPIIRDSVGMRKLTTNECAKLQGYHDLRVPLGVSEQHIYKQIGNSVSVPVLKAIAEEIGNAVKAVEKLMVSESVELPKINLRTAQILST